MSITTQYVAKICKLAIIRCWSYETKLTAKHLLSKLCTVESSKFYFL